MPPALAPALAPAVDDAMDALTFDLHGETFALDAGLVREVLDLAPETRVPGAAAFVNSVINFRGRVIPLADLRLAFKLPQSEPTLDTRIIVIALELEGEPTLIGLRADKVHEVTTLAASSTESTPRLGMSWRPDFIRGLVKRDHEVIVIPDLEQIFSARGRCDDVAPPVHSH